MSDHNDQACFQQSQEDKHSVQQAKRARQAQQLRINLSEGRVCQTTMTKPGRQASSQQNQEDKHSFEQAQKARQAQQLIEPINQLNNMFRGRFLDMSTNPRNQLNEDRVCSESESSIYYFTWNGDISTEFSLDLFYFLSSVKLDLVTPSDPTSDFSDIFQ